MRTVWQGETLRHRLHSCDKNIKHNTIKKDQQANDWSVSKCTISYS